MQWVCSPLSSVCRQKDLFLLSLTS
ncbi:unnamed protein product [Ectocarpus sp. CCAP 1310/34]|nr:unnamed protein product [Ectocarpus sp. CCAP 1310/34]